MTGLTTCSTCLLGVAAERGRLCRGPGASRRSPHSLCYTRYPQRPYRQCQTSTGREREREEEMVTSFKHLYGRFQWCSGGRTQGYTVRGALLSAISPRYISYFSPLHRQNSPRYTGKILPATLQASRNDYCLLPVVSNPTQPHK